MENRTGRILSYIFFGLVIFIFILNLLPLRHIFDNVGFINAQYEGDMPFESFGFLITYYFRIGFISIFSTFTIVSLIFAIVVEDKKLKKIYITNIIISVLGGLISVISIIAFFAELFNSF